MRTLPLALGFASLLLAAGAGAARTSPFQDVPLGHWAELAINWAVRQGIMTGRSQSEFAPEQPVNRAELAIVMLRHNALLLERIEELELQVVRQNQQIQDLTQILDRPIFNGTMY